MAKYIIDETSTVKFEKNNKFTFINLIPAVVWSIPLHQKLFPDAGWWTTFELCALFVIVYMVLSFKPVVAIVPSIAGGIIFTMIAWTPIDLIGNNVVRIVVKGVALVL